MILSQRELTVERLSRSRIRSYLVTCPGKCRSFCNIPNQLFYNYIMLKLIVLLKKIEAKGSPKYFI